MTETESVSMSSGPWTCRSGAVHEIKSSGPGETPVVYWRCEHPWLPAGVRPDGQVLCEDCPHRDLITDTDDPDESHAGGER